jgi:hypothetical protein
MRTVLTRLSIIVTICLLLALPMFVQAQAGQAVLVGRAVLPAGTLADGPRSGQKLGTKVINGLKVPFASQPVGNITAILPGNYGGSWLVLSDSVFNNAQSSDDYLLRIYTVEVDWRGNNGGGGTATVVDWINLIDPAKKVTKALRNANAANRPLSGGDFSPRAFQHLADGTFWVAEAAGPSLLHFGANGQLLDAPIALGGPGALQGMSKLPDNRTLVIAQRSGASVVVRTFDTGGRAFGSGTATFALANGGNNVSGIAMVNGQQLITIEQDSKQGNGAQFKQVFLVDISTQPASKTPLLDLLNISDPSSISTADVFSQPANAIGLGASFKFPFADIGAIYPLDGQTLVLVNNNNVPFGLGRSPAQADDTEYIAVQIAQPLNLDGAFNVPR